MENAVVLHQGGNAMRRRATGDHPSRGELRQQFGTIDAPDCAALNGPRRHAARVRELAAGQQRRFEIRRKVPVGGHAEFTVEQWRARQVDAERGIRHAVVCADQLDGRAQVGVVETDAQLHAGGIAGHASAKNNCVHRGVSRD
uniref:Uncharacterized protein n=1 Tax=Cupriavidus taiwanensis TaxID=164546 RepID=A0A375HBH8_9BURK|nr:protein of unknown function [Cupriavidus taiwanensis]